jgi:hypothetical protein
MRPVLRREQTLCSRACANASRGRPLAERFLDHYQIGKPDACWPWAGTKDRDGYGVIGDGPGKQYRAHRIAYERIHGTVPKGQNVLHRCDNPPCCNPSHLFAGSAAENNADKHRKNRHSHGTKHPLAKLTDDDVRAIRGMYPLLTQTAIARQYGIDQTTVSEIVLRKKWQHI